MEYNFYPHQDSVGNDISHTSHTDSKDVCDKTKSAVAYNTLGYVKSCINPPDQWITIKGEGLYIKKEHDPIQKAIDSIINYDGERLPITFTITTCKRLYYFLITMQSFIVRCKDAYLFKEWICVDDNSSESDRDIMRTRFPFFKFICKSLDEKGHAKSMNIILDAVKSEYILHYEDDWLVHTDFKISPLVEWLRDSPCTQLLLRKIDRAPPSEIDRVGQIPVYSYKCNFYHYIKPKINSDFDKFYNILPQPTFEDNKKDWWWPGLSLNPSIIKINEIKRDIGRFNEAIIPELFEYEYALQYFIKNHSSAYLDFPINHIGQTSGYVLNNEYRSYD